MKYFVVMALVCLSIYSVNSVSNPGQDINDPAFVKHFQSLPIAEKKGVLQSFSVRELFDFTQSKHFVEHHELAAEVYGANYGENKVLAVDRSVEDEVFEFKDDVIRFGNSKTFIAFLKAFNRHIKYIRIDVAYMMIELKDVLNAIDENCAKTVIKFEIRRVFNTAFDDITKLSFPNVEELTLASNAYLMNGDLNLNGAFPSVRKLACLDNRIEDETWIVNNFSNLTHFQVAFGNDFVSERNLIKILEKNPTIRGLSIIGATTSILRIINKRFPNIVDFALIHEIFPDFDEEPVHMEHVQRFLFQANDDLDNDEDDTSLISFAHLKEVQWYHGSVLNIVKSHKHDIETLQMNTNIFGDEELNELTGMVKLETVTFTFEPDMYGYPDDEENPKVTANGILNFLRDNPVLKAIRLVKPTEVILEVLREQQRQFVLVEESDGNAYLFKGSVQPIQWTDDMKFLRANLY